MYIYNVVDAKKKFKVLASFTNLDEAVQWKAHRIHSRDLRIWGKSRHESFATDLNGIYHPSDILLLECKGNA